ncbi:MAG: sensor histidine kinase [Candidatus Latescibacterota bacterium]
MNEQHDTPEARKSPEQGTVGIAEAGKQPGPDNVLTDLQRAEQALYESEERYRTLFTRMIDGFALHEIILDSEGKPKDYRFLEVNPAFERSTGLPAADIVGKTLLEVLPGAEPFWIETYGDVAQNGNCIHFEQYTRTLDRYYAVTAFSPKKGRFATLFIDITERKRAENALQKAYEELRAQSEELQTQTEQLQAQAEELRNQSEKILTSNEALRESEAALAKTNRLLETVLDNTHSRIAYMDTRFNFIMVNRGYAAADGRDVSFFPGENHFALYPNEENERLFRRVAETGEPYFTFGKAFEYAEHPERGTTYWDWSLIPVKDAAGGVAGLVLTLSDVTERILLQEKVQRLKREQEAFMRHEVKNLFAPMQLFSELLLQDAENLNEQQVHYLQRIAESSERVTGFIDSLKRIHDIQAGTYCLKRVKYPLDAIIRRAIRDLEPLAEKRGVSIRFHAPEEQFPMSLDMQLMPGVFTNLILNAVEHVAELKNTEDKTVTIDFRKEQDRSIVCINNRGEPIPAERLATFFEKFNVGPEKRHGTGLGTTYAFMVTKAHGGDITVTSNREEGTTVTLAFSGG